MNWSYGLDLDVLKSTRGFLMIEVIISAMVISVMVFLLYQLMMLFQ
jgi:Tfp pilus assembly protein PilV